MKLTEGIINENYSINAIQTNEEGMRDFLFTLGCFPGESITIISEMASNYIINIKDARYSIDEHLASAIVVQKCDSPDMVEYRTRAI